MTVRSSAVLRLYFLPVAKFAYQTVLIQHKQFLTVSVLVDDPLEPQVRLMAWINTDSVTHFPLSHYGTVKGFLPVRKIQHQNIRVRQILPRGQLFQITGDLI